MAKIEDWVEQLAEDSVKCGEKEYELDTPRYEISLYNDEWFWLTNEIGEGMTIGKVELDDILHKYFTENF